MQNFENIFNSTENLIADSANQLMGYGYFEKDGIEKIRELITRNDLITIEEYTKKTTEELEKAKPGVCKKYNSLVEEIKNPSLTMERLKEIMKEVFEITH